MYAWSLSVALSSYPLPSVEVFVLIVNSVSADFDLTMVHISTLVELMPPRVAAKWRHIGTALKLDKGVLQSIAKRASNMYPEDFFSDMLHQWLKRGATLFHEKPSLSALCRALCGDSIGEESLGTSLEKSMRNMQGI